MRCSAIFNDEVAPGDGALKTWRELFVLTILKSCNRFPFLSIAWALTPAPGLVKSWEEIEGIFQVNTIF